jgi:glycolate oxidase iron-sulfur subunit
MYARPAGDLEGTRRGHDAQALLARCVHCGFCLPACPTYRLGGNELDGPRGRIYLVKQLVEGGLVGTATLTHLDRCLTCRACETACPSGVQYGLILDLGRSLAEQRIGRPLPQRLRRRALAEILSRRRLVAGLVWLGSRLRPVLPARLRAGLPPSGPSRAAAPAAVKPASRAPIVLLEGCVQPSLSPEINRAAARVLACIGVPVQRLLGESCCGALGLHLGFTTQALDRARRNVGACAAALDQGAQAIVSTASACGLAYKDYGRWLAEAGGDDRAAARVSAATRDLSEFITPGDLERAGLSPGRGPRIAWQSPCTLQHGQGSRGRVEALLTAAGFRLVPVSDSGQCCGSAGTYSLLEPERSRELRRRKLAALTAETPEMIATANVGCLLHLRETSPVPVRHWIELVDEALRTVDAAAGR